MSELLSRVGYLTKFGSIWHRFASKGPDMLVEDYLYGRGEFSIKAQEGFERELLRNYDNKRLGIG